MKKYILGTIIALTSHIQAAATLQPVDFFKQMTKMQAVEWVEENQQKPEFKNSIPTLRIAFADKKVKYADLFAHRINPCLGVFANLSWYKELYFWDSIITRFNSTILESFLDDLCDNLKYGHITRLSLNLDDFINVSEAAKEKVLWSLANAPSTLIQIYLKGGTSDYMKQFAVHILQNCPYVKNFNILRTLKAKDLVEVSNALKNNRQIIRFGFESRTGKKMFDLTGLEALCNALKSHPTLRILSLGGQCYMGGQRVPEYIAQMISESNLTWVNLHSVFYLNSITPLAKALETNTTIRTLILGSITLSHSFVLLNSLAKNKTLKYCTADFESSRYDDEENFKSILTKRQHDIP